MVWHAYTLNPRCFLEDCFRYGKIDFYATGIPWALVDSAINPSDLEYSPSDDARRNFEATTGCAWDNILTKSQKHLQCPGCLEDMAVPWTEGAGFTSGKIFHLGTGYADKDFETKCNRCGLVFSHDALRVAKFRRDVELLCSPADLPLSGTVLEHTGQPPWLGRVKLMPPACSIPNGLLKAGLALQVQEQLVFRKDGSPAPDMNIVKKLWEEGIKDKKIVSTAKRSLNNATSKPEGRAIRRMMSRYWFNDSPFALDLVGAVIRQGTFIEKMHNIDWLHSPALMSTMQRCVLKYGRFFDIMVKNPRNIAVPTLDVDLAWHTHQTHTLSYYAYSNRLAVQLIDHDDKIEESKLNTFFTWTSKTYQDKYGEPYSECTCWYCEAVRESHTSSVSRLFKTSSSRAQEKLHDAEDVSSDPLKSAHISAHNAVKDYDTDVQSRIQHARLDKAYHAACARAKKKGRQPPKRDDYYYHCYWGYPMMYPYPMYMPYGVVPLGGDAYCSDPHSINTSQGRSTIIIPQSQWKNTKR